MSRSQWDLCESRQLLLISDVPGKKNCQEGLALLRPTISRTRRESLGETALFWQGRAPARARVPPGRPGAGNAPASGAPAAPVPRTSRAPGGRGGPPRGAEGCAGPRRPSPACGGNVSGLKDAAAAPHPPSYKGPSPLPPQPP